MFASLEVECVWEWWHHFLIQTFQDRDRWTSAKLFPLWQKICSCGVHHIVQRKKRITGGNKLVII